MTVSLDIQKRVLYAKYFLSRAKKAQAEQSDLGVATSLLLMHDAAELFMLAVTDRLGLGRNWKFMDFWNDVKQKSGKEPGHKVPMGQLNDLRTSLKHSGTLPHAQTVRDLMPRVEAFCEKITNEFLDLDLAELSLATLVADHDVRKTLQKAEKAIKAGDKENAYLNVRLAFDVLRRLIASDVALVGKPRAIKVPRSPDATYKSLLNLQAIVFDLVGTVNTLMLGIDPVKYRFLMANTPVVSWTTSGEHQATFTHDYDFVRDEVFEKCFDFVIEVALNALT